MKFILLIPGFSRTMETLSPNLPYTMLLIQGRILQNITFLCLLAVSSSRGIVVHLLWYGQVKNLVCMLLCLLQNSTVIGMNFTGAEVMEAETEAASVCCSTYIGTERSFRPHLSVVQARPKRYMSAIHPSIFLKNVIKMVLPGPAEPVRLVRPWLDQLLNLVAFFILI